MIFAHADIPLVRRRAADLKLGIRVCKSMNLSTHFFAQRKIISHIDSHVSKILLAHEQQLHQVDLLVSSGEEMDLYLLERIQSDIVSPQPWLKAWTEESFALGNLISLISKKKRMVHHLVNPTNKLNYTSTYINLEKNKYIQIIKASYRANILKNC
jgi:hypothetical protein